MKSCPTCNRTFEDTFTFCLIDGAILSAPFDPAETRTGPRRSSEPPPTEVIRSPAKPADANPPLHSTIRAPAPQVPNLHQPKVAPRKQSAVTTKVPLLFRLPLAARGLLAVVCILPWIFVTGWGWPWTVWYPPLAGVLAIIAGTILYARHQSGRFLIIEGAIAIFFAGISWLATDSWQSWRYWHAAWAMVSGALTVAAAFELRKYVTRTWVLGAAGLFFATYTLGGPKFLFLSQLTYNTFMAITYLQGCAVFLSGLTLTAFSLLTRGKQPDLT